MMKKLQLHAIALLKENQFWRFNLKYLPWQPANPFEVLVDSINANNIVTLLQNMYKIWVSNKHILPWISVSSNII